MTMSDPPAEPNAPVDGSKRDTDPEVAALLDYVSSRSVGCPQCGYDLHALTKPTCPECGCRLKLSVQLDEPMSGRWIAMTVALSIGAGVGLLALIGVMIAGDFPPWNEDTAALILAMLYFMACVPMAAVAWASHRRFRRLSEFAQGSVSAAAVLGTIIAFFMIIATMAR